MLTWCEICPQALRHNLQVLQQSLGPDPEQIAVVKANAYGHGLDQVAPVCAQEGVTWFGLVGIEEAQALREMLGPSVQLLLLGYIEPQEVAAALALGARLAIFDPAHAREIHAAAKDCGKTARVHLKVDTGMGRHGVNAEDVPALVELCHSLEKLRVEGLWTHLAQADDPDPTYTQTQLERWNAVCINLHQKGWLPPFRHVANSAGALLYPSARETAVRCGIALYGLWPHPALAPRFKAQGIDLRPLLTWKSRLVQVKTVPPQTPISYGGTWVTPRETLVGVVAVGYADGYDRGLSNVGQVLIQGTCCPIRGRVCMKHLMVDLGPAVPRGPLKVGEEVVLLGRQGGAEITADAMATWLDTINYEVTTRLPARLPRISREP